MDIFSDKEALESFISGLGLWGPVVFFLLQVIQAVIVPIPGNFLTMAGGALFGIWPGFLLAYAGNVAGSIIGFLIVRKAGRAALAKFAGSGRFDRYTAAIGSGSNSSRAKIVLILVVLLPFLPSDFMCLAAGMTSMSFRAFFLIVITCRPWGQFTAALLGVGSVNMPQGFLIPLIAVIIVVCVLGVYFAPRIEGFVFRLAHRLAGRFSRKERL